MNCDDVFLYTNGDSVSWGAELENKDDRFSTLICKNNNWFDLNVSSAGISNDRIYRTTIRDVSKFLNDKEIYCEGKGFFKPKKLFVLINFTSPTRVEYFDGDVYQREQLWYDKDRWGDIDKDYMTESKFILNNTKLAPSFVRMFNQIISLDSFLKNYRIPHLFTNAFFEYDIKEFIEINNNLNVEKIMSQFDDFSDYFGLNDLYGIIPDSYKNFNLLKYLKEKNDMELFAKRGHPSKLGHQQIYNLLKNYVTYE